MLVEPSVVLDVGLTVDVDLVVVDGGFVLVEAVVVLDAGLTVDVDPVVVELVEAGVVLDSGSMVDVDPIVLDAVLVEIIVELDSGWMLVADPGPTLVEAAVEVVPGWTLAVDPVELNPGCVLVEVAVELVVDIAIGGALESVAAELSLQFSPSHVLQAKNSLITQLSYAQKFVCLMAQSRLTTEMRLPVRGLL